VLDCRVQSTTASTRRWLSLRPSAPACSSSSEKPMQSNGSSSAPRLQSPDFPAAWMATSSLLRSCRCSGLAAWRMRWLPTRATALTRRACRLWPIRTPPQAWRRPCAAVPCPTLPSQARTSDNSSSSSTAAMLNQPPPLHPGAPAQSRRHRSRRRLRRRRRAPLPATSPPRAGLRGAPQTCPRPPRPPR